MVQNKHFLFQLGYAPHRGLLARETMDMLLMVAAFEQPLALLFLDDGVWQLFAGQHHPATGVTAMLQALELYDIDEIWIEIESLEARGLHLESLILQAKPISRTKLPEFYHHYDLIVSA